ncbi:MAG: radical SAM family heme chaperone HemW [Victivallales bacterium]|nr:radical SAM family heme chaperone HemW [Victivallales bacterium]
MPSAFCVFESLYIHVPFCRGKCDYCAFYSEPKASRDEMVAYRERLVAELREHSAQCAKLSSIFIGGGTPSVLPPDEWPMIFDEIHRKFQLDSKCEWTCEANPDSLTPELIACWAENGVNRISLGIQAFQQELRDRIGRRGSLGRLAELVGTILANGITRYNFDLIFNIPGQSVRQWRDTLEMALELNPEHISAYALTVEEGTRLAKSYPLLDDSAFLEFWEATDSVLARNGIRRYEISNFAKPGCECCHNLNVWHGMTYLGCGPAATSFDGADRWTNVPSLSSWLAGTRPEYDIIAKESRAAEILAFGMRAVDGWQWEEFRRRTGFDAVALRGPQLRKLEAMGLLELTENGAMPTAKGLLFNDNIAMELL